MERTFMKATILLIEGGNTQAKTFVEFFEESGFFSLHAETGETGIEYAKAKSPDLIILGQVLPDIGGLEVCRSLKSDDATRRIPVMVYLHKKRPEDFAAAIQSGAVDCISRPIQQEELKARILSHLRSRENVELLYREKKYLESLIENVQDMASRDPLTGLLNRKYGLHQTKIELTRSIRYHLPLVVALIDIDRMKTINSDHGQNAGDALLSQMGKLIRENFRDIDICSRFENDDFLVSLPHCSKEESLTAMGRLQKRLSSNPFRDLPLELGISVSIGMVQLPHTEIKNEELLLSTLFSALKKAKEKGEASLAFWNEEEKEEISGG